MSPYPGPARPGRAAERETGRLLTGAGCLEAVTHVTILSDSRACTPYVCRHTLEA